MLEGGGGAEFIFEILYTNDAIENDVQIESLVDYKRNETAIGFFRESNQLLAFLVETEFLIHEAGIECL